MVKDAGADREIAGKLELLKGGRHACASDTCVQVAAPAGGGMRPAW